MFSTDSGKWFQQSAITFFIRILMGLFGWRHLTILPRVILLYPLSEKKVKKDFVLYAYGFRAHSGPYVGPPR